MNIPIYTTWIVGIINGYKIKNNGIPDSIKYGTLSLAAGVNIVNTYITTKVKVNPRYMGSIIMIPIMIGANFCLGSHLGKAIQYVQYNPNRINILSRIKRVIGYS